MARQGRVSMKGGRGLLSEGPQALDVKRVKMYK